MRRVLKARWWNRDILEDEARRSIGSSNWTYQIAQMGIESLAQALRVVWYEDLGYWVSRVLERRARARLSYGARWIAPLPEDDNPKMFRARLRILDGVPHDMQEYPAQAR